MKPLTTTSSVSFVGGFTAVPGVSTKGVQHFLDSLPSTTRTFQEGTATFDEFRCCLLRESEQQLLMAENCYARALEGLRHFSAYWSLVGLYYSAFMASKAVLGMYGCWMGRPKKWVEVADAGVGKIQLRYSTKVYPSLVSGSHQVAWVAFYETMASLSSFLTSSVAVLAKTPVNNSKTWLIDARNDANYSPSAAFELMVELDQAFDPANVPNCFSGTFQTMLRLAGAYVLFAKESALRVGLATDVCLPDAARVDWIRSRVTSPLHPALEAFARAELPQLEF